MYFRFRLSVLLLPLSTLMTSCDDSSSGSQAAYPPPLVKTVSMQTEDLPLTKEYPGRLLPIRLAEVRARVSGIVLQRTFAEGSDVTAGETLFQIDPAKFEAAVDAAKAQLARAEASFSLASQQEGRAESLLQKNVASKDQYDVAVATRQQAQAEVAVAKANLKTAELDLGYASVRSPINGRIDAAIVTAGAFVRQEDGTHMATVRDLSSVYVDFIAPLTDLTAVQKLSSDGAPGEQDNSAFVELITNNGTTYGERGRLLFSSAVVNETTGQVSLRAEFRNPNRSLLPGTYVRVRMAQGTVHQALLLPQRAVQWDTLGQAKVMIVQDGKAVPQPVIATRSVGSRWLVTEGLKVGDQVIVDGAEKAMAGAPVTAQPIAAASTAVTPDADCDGVCTQQAKL
ncbi:MULTISPECIES: efflux RND transporter periplasmic adaptor subunit [Rhizobium/Agrobacterium group]|uniref:efflux RND transporter periplasmic adaptor subunit n=1 Tax=Rhizobium/Agrobacterium group TaxID=227290 RepID=UPI001ADC3FA3|nr:MULTISPECIES: efflux RND transporter periplasmic adaptor subunit [Rhizobium/Agrobacterium group]MBO9112730.1 efflux RND transporter periplasmic adaptor subunit [Agrobacterium sp. S2/73]QXZ76216.1 efflux RND transporter periplasmic adaptor subunit [Agrobacterium sp. S7/73]QYA17236.1 efflux RND transporter periplasmic adaptor subunit [Rhizobium sp. AB2/73]UEQ85190.1 efflux RND transporter periplasmic adaptor subunit [Rhizobium sp. AB2/73]